MGDIVVFKSTPGSPELKKGLEESPRTEKEQPGGDTRRQSRAAQVDSDEWTVVQKRRKKGTTDLNNNTNEAEHSTLLRGEQDDRARLRSHTPQAQTDEIMKDMERRDDQMND